MCLDDHIPAMCMLLACAATHKVRYSWDKLVRLLKQEMLAV